jgi:hypothetical protein
MSAGAKKRDIYHGIVLSKLAARKDQKFNLYMIETRKEEPGSFYVVNDKIYLYMKYKTGRISNGNIIWDFQFQIEHIEDIKSYNEKRPIYLALICLHQKPTKKNEWFPGQIATPQICLLYPENQKKCINIDSAKQQIITVKFRLNTQNSFRVNGPLNQNKPLTIYRTDIDKWKIPGS